MSYEDILEEVKRLPVHERFLLLESISRLLREELVVSKTSATKLTASDIRRLPLAERNKILAEGAQKALLDYQPGSELIEVLEALAGDDFYEYEEK